MKKTGKRLVLMALGCIMALSAMAQVTTSSISGKVTDGKDPLIGATIVVVQESSGTRYGTVTNKDGFYAIYGVKPGSSYRIEIAYVGFKKEIHKDMSVNLGEAFVLNARLEEESVNVKEVVIVGSKRSGFNAEKNGAAINVNTAQMNIIPTINRSVNDITKLTPQANGNQIGGGNYRQNFIMVDGAQFNNNFGIGTNLPGNGSPISLDALDQISVNITPYDVRQSGFIGASINAVTRSGTNDFSGSAYTYMQSEKYKGNKVGDASFVKSPNKDNIYGFRLGGPILKNKLFFFVNYETEKNVVPGPSRVAATATAPMDYNNNIARPTASDMDMISNYLKTKYGYETGPYQGYSNDSPSSKFLARIDWNINKNNKLNVRYSQSNSKTPSYPSTSYSPFSSLYTNNRQSMDAMWYKNSGYYQEQNFSSVSAELNSILFSKVLNTLRFTYSYQNEPRSTDGSLFPFVDILKDGKPYVSFGTELFSYGNLRQVKTTTITDDVAWTIGKHSFTAGLQFESDATKNGFMRFGSSYYVFNSWDDFANGAKAADFGVTFSNTPGYAQAFPRFQYNQYSAYAQDEFAVNNKLKIVGGLRVDLPTYSQPYDAHPIISTLDFGGNAYNTSTLPKSRLMLSPRIGFNYNIKEDRSLVLRGGTGIFTGRVPFVWVVGQVSDAGMAQTTLTYTGTANTPGAFNPSTSAYYPATQPAVGTIVPSTFTVISKDFKMPQSWKSSLGIDAQLPWGLKGTLEGIYNKDFNTAFFVNEGLKGGTPMNIAGYPDNRIIYPSANASKYYYLRTNAGVISSTGTSGVTPIVLENRKGGYYYSISAKLEKSFDNGFYGMLAYTYSDARNLVDGAGDQASSAWSGNANVNGANSVEKSYTSYVMPHKLISSVSYRKEYLKFMATTVSLFYEGGAQGRFSYVYSSNIVRDGGGSNNLIYVPKDPSEITFVDNTFKNAQGVNVTWTAADQSAAFFKFIDQDSYLKTRKGKYAERNGAILPWRNQFDLKILQEFFVKVGGKRNTIQLSLDILNVGNLLNRDWGKSVSYVQNNILAPANASSVVAGGTVKPTYKLNPYNDAMITTSYRDNISYSSTYSMQFGIRYIFN